MFRQLNSCSARTRSCRGRRRWYVLHSFWRSLSPRFINIHGAHRSHTDRLKGQTDPSVSRKVGTGTVLVASCMSGTEPDCVACRVSLHTMPTSEIQAINAFYKLLAYSRIWRSRREGCRCWCTRRICHMHSSHLAKEIGKSPCGK